jgi:competence protein ComEA
VDRTTSPWRALEDPGDALPDSDSTVRGRLRSAPIVLFAVVLLVAIAFAGVFVLVGPNGSSVVSITSAGGDSPSLGPADARSNLTAGGDGGGPTGQNPDGAAAGEPTIGGSDPSAEPGDLVVEVAGAVARPGLYHLATGARVADAIAAAGGYGPRIDVIRATAELNLAAHVRDGDRIIVPSRDDRARASPGSASSGPPGTAQAPAHSGPVNLNTATAAELDALPGIGPVTLAKIIASRTQQAFRSISDLRTRKLVGAAEFAQIQKLVSVR